MRVYSGPLQQPHLLVDIVADAVIQPMMKLESD